MSMDILDKNCVNLVMCRACMMHINPAICKHLFAHRFAEMFTKCTDIKVDISDGLPAHVCSKCLKTLKLAHSFKELCVTSDLKLKELLKSNRSSLRNDPLLDTEYVDVPEIKMEEEYLSEDNDFTNKVLELPNHELGNTIVCNTESGEEDTKMGQVYNWQTNAVPGVFEYYVITQLQTGTNIEDEGNNSPERIKVATKETIGQKKQYSVCAICQHSYATPQVLKKHLLTHNTIPRFKCDDCDKVFTLESYLKVHKRVHSKIRPFVCDFCGKTFIRKDQFNKHKRTHDTLKSKITAVSCRHCNKTYISDYTLKEHIKRVHMAEKNVVCDLCGKMVYRLADLVTHLRTHTKEKPYECSHCERRCATKSHLIAHTRIHTGDRPHHCDLCPKTFRMSTFLREHRRTHTGEKPHVCHVCQRSFSKRFTLTTHMKTHTGQQITNNTANTTPT